MSFQITFNGPVNDNDYYFVPIDVVGGGPGPVPLFPSLPGQGWLTSSDGSTQGATHFVEYHQRQYLVYQIISIAPFQTQLIGAPVRYTLPNPGDATLGFTIDLNQIGAVNTSVDVNIITTDHPFDVVRLIDALGPTGHNFINVDITTSRTVSNADTAIEQAGDVMDQNRNVQPVNDQTRPLDIIDWTITTNINQ